MFAYVWGIPSSYALVNGQNSVYVLGQSDGLTGSPSPIFTKGGLNNAAHKLGLSAPIVGIVMDTVDHRLFVSDTGNNRVLVYNLDANNAFIDRIPDNVIGQQNFWGNAAAISRSGLRVPNGLAYDSVGKRLFVANNTGNRVTIYDVTTITDGEDAVNVLGQTSYTVITAATTQVGLNVPTGVAYDETTGRLFVAQNTGNRVSVFNLATGLGATNGQNADNLLGQYDDSLSAPGPIYTKGTAHNGGNNLGLSAPIIGIALDPTDHKLFLSDTSNHRVLVYNLNGSNQLIDRIPDNVLGQINFYTVAAATTQIGLSTPNGLAFDDTNNRLFVAEGGVNQVVVYDTTSITDGENAVNVLGQITFTASTAATTQAGLNVPQDIAYDSANSRLFVSQSTGNRVTVYDVTTITDGEDATSVLGQANFTATTAATTQAGMNVPYGLAFDATNNRLFVSQGTGNRVTVYDVTAITDGENATGVLGQANFTATTAATTQAGMNAPRGISYNSASQILYVAQTTGNRITTYDVASISNGENAINVIGQANFTATTAATTQAGLNAPTGVLFDSTNQYLYVPQSGANRVSIFDVTAISDGENAADLLGQYDSDLTTPGPIFTKSTAHNGPSKLGLSAGIIGLALDPTDHRLFVSDTGNNRVLVYNLDSNDLLIDRIPDSVLGQTNYHSNTAATTQAGMNVPNGIAYDDTNNRLFVAQGTGNRVTVYDVTAITDGENATGVLGQANFTATTAATTQAGMNVPQDVAYDSTNSRLFVSQSTGNRVTVYDVTAITDGENATGVLGQANFTATTAATTQAGMNVPYGLALSGSTVQTLFVAQGTGNRVTAYEVSTVSDGENAVSVLGQTTFTATTAGVTQTGMSAPRGISYDATNKRLYVAQTTAVRVTVYDVAAITNGENAVNVIGQSTFTASTASTVQEGLSAPTGVLADPAHNRVYVMDSTLNRVTSYDTHAGIGNGENASGVLGQANFTATTAATTQAGMNVPFAVTLSGSNALFVSEGTSNRVTLFDVAVVTDGENAVKVLGQANFTTATAATTQAGMNAPRGIAYNPSTKTLFVAQTTGNRVTTYNVAAITDGENAINVLGQSLFTSTAAETSQSGLNAPNGVYVDTANSKLFVLQSGASRVSIFDVAAIVDKENASNGLGQYDDSLSNPLPIYTKGAIDNGPHSLGLSDPAALAIDAKNHRLFVSDYTNNRVLVYNLDSRNLPLDMIPDNVLGQAVFYTNAAATTQAGLSAPSGLAFDEAGNRLFVSEFGNHRVVAFDTTSITDGENAIAVIGQLSFTTATSNTTQTGLFRPESVAYDQTTGNLYVAESGNDRVSIFTIARSGAPQFQNSFYFYGL